MSVHSPLTLPSSQNTKPTSIPDFDCSHPISSVLILFLLVESELHNRMENMEEDVDDHVVQRVSEDVDRFTDTLSAVGDKSDPPEVPHAVEKFSKIVESRIVKYYSQDPQTKFGKMTKEDSFFFEAVGRLSKLSNAIGDFPSSFTTATPLNRTSVVLQRAMTFLEEEFREILEYSRHLNANPESACCVLVDAKSINYEKKEFPAYPPEVVTKMNRIATAMISAGYETECCQVYSIARRNAFNEAFRNLDFDVSFDDVRKMHWESLEGEIARWIAVIKQCASVLFPGERKLCESVFSENPSNSVILFSNLARAVVIQLLNFADAVLSTRRSQEKLFKYIDMYEALRDLVLAITETRSDDCGCELISEISAAADRLGEAAASIFCDLENSIKGDAAKTTVPGGAVHPLTRYVMNYLKYACEYRDSLEQIFQKKKTPVQSERTNERSESPRENQNQNSPLAAQVMSVTGLLDANLEAKSKLYRDHSLRYIFLMNNGRYILQKIKGSGEILRVVGDTWYRMRSTEVRKYHKNYQRETWGKVLECLGHGGGLQVNEKVNKPMLKERFKSFNGMFDDIHRTQSAWVVTDDQLRSELIVSMSAVVIPAYRSFLGRFRQYLDSGRNSDKYIKYQPEDIETLIEGFFSGNTTSTARRRM